MRANVLKGKAYEHYLHYYIHLSFSDNINITKKIQPSPEPETDKNSMMDGNDKISNLSQLVAAELDYLEEKFEAAKLSMDKAIVQIKKARRKFDDLVMDQLEQQLKTTRGGSGGGGGGGGGVNETGDQLLLPVLEELKSKISILKSKIPFNLINPSKYEQLMNNSRFLWIPRKSPPQRRVIGVPPAPPLSAPPPLHPPTTYRDAQKLTWPEEIPYSCLALFLENTLIKKSLLLRLLESSTPDSCKAGDLLEKCVTSGLINPAYKKCSLIIDSYTLYPLICSALRKKYVTTGVINPEDYTFLAKSIDNEDIIHSDPIQFPNPKCLEVLHLGIWIKSSTCHVEVSDPDVFFRNISTLDQLRYLSLRRVSMVKELPKCITKLRSLRTLDLKSCHDLEVIPPAIANLRGSLTNLDMSECYFLEHMPIALALLHELRVLKGFFIGKTNNVNDKTCTLQDLVPLSKLVKLNIYTNAERFPNENDLTTLHEFKELRNLTISWGGCPVSKIAADTHQELLIEKDPADGDEKFDFKLEKLDLQCIPSTIMYSWLRPDNFKTLKRLYIRGGQLHNLGQNQQDQWSVEMLRLKHLKKLTVDWDELKKLFPRMIFLEKVDCSNLTTFHTGHNGVWKNTA